MKSSIYIKLIQAFSFIEGSVLPSQNCLLLSWGFEAHVKREFEILIGGSTDNWVSSRCGNVPENAFVAGHTEHGETLFIGRSKHKNRILVGKIHPSFKLCYAPDIGGTKELEIEDYEVLVV